MGWGIPHLLRGMETFFPRGGNPFSMKAWGPIFRGMRSPFPTDGSLFFEGSDALSKGWEPLFRWMGTLLPRDGNPFFRGVGRLLRGSGDPFAKRMGTAFPKDACDHHFPKDGTKQRSNLPAACPLHISKTSLDAGLKTKRKNTYGTYKQLRTLS